MADYSDSYETAKENMCRYPVHNLYIIFRNREYETFPRPGPPSTDT